MKPPMTEQEFLQEWEKGNLRPYPEHKSTEEYQKEFAVWEGRRNNALSNFIVEKEKREKQEEARRREKERYERQLNAQLLQKAQEDQRKREEELDRQLREDLETEKIYTEKDLETADYTKGMVMLASLSVLASLGKTGIFAGEKMADLGATLKEHMKEHKEELLHMLNQKDYEKHIADGVLGTLGEVTNDALHSGNLKSKQMEFLKNAMENLFQRPESEISLPERKVKHAMEERDSGKQLQSFWAVKRMAELMAGFEYSKVVLADKAREQEHFSEQELRDFMVGSFAVGELEKSRKADALTEKALIFGKTSKVLHKSGYEELRYGDDEIYEEIKKTDTYKKLKDMTIKDIRDMLIPHKDKSCDCVSRERKEEKVLKKETPKMVLKRQD